jgi:hypothetical protein
MTKGIRFLAISVFLMCVSGTGMASEVQDCSRFLNLSFSKVGGLQELNYSRPTQEQISEMIEAHYQALTQIWDSQTSSSKRYLVGNYLEKYFQPIHDLNRQVTGVDFTEKSARKPIHLEAVEDLLNGKTSLSSKIEDLQQAIERPPSILFTKEKKEYRIRDLAEEIRTCIIAFEGCSKSLPEVLKTVDAHYKMLNQFILAVNDQMELLNALGKRLAEPGPLSENSEVRLVASKKAEEFVPILMTLELMRSNSINLIANLQTAIASASSFTDFAVRQAVVDAAKIDVDLNWLLKDFSRLSSTGTGRSSTGLEMSFFSAIPPEQVQAEIQRALSSEDPGQKLKTLHEYLVSLQGRQLTLDHVESIITSIPRARPEGIEKDELLVASMKRANIANYLPGFTPYEVAIYWTVLKKMQPAKATDRVRLKKLVGDIQQATRAALRKKQASFVESLLKFFDKELSRAGSA